VSWYFAERTNNRGQPFFATSSWWFSARDCAGRTRTQFNGTRTRSKVMAAALRFGFSALAPCRRGRRRERYRGDDRSHMRAGTALLPACGSALLNWLLKLGLRPFDAVRFPHRHPTCQSEAPLGPGPCSC
jgi:hypothetical protein